MGVISLALPTVESGKAYAPGQLALEVQNLERTDEGTLRSVRGPCPLIPDYGAGYPYTGTMYGVFHAVLDSGTRDVTLIRSGGTLYEQRGWGRTATALETGLSQDPTGKYPDQFCEVAGKVVWTNGVDTPRIFDGYKLLPLGYSARPGTCSPMGPTDDGHPVFVNKSGYSHPGKIGTAGDTYDAGEGALLAGVWYYYVQFEDAFGNLSPLSVASGPVTLRQERTMNIYWTDYADYPDTTAASKNNLGDFAPRLDDLLRQFFVGGVPRGPTGTVARRVYRSRNAKVYSPEPRLLVRVPDNISACYPDNVPDAGLGGEPARIVPVPTFRVMCAHNGSLVIANFPGNPGRLRVSQAGFPGTFEEHRFADIPDGAEVTAVVSYGGSIYAFSETAVYEVQDDGVTLRARPVTAGVGCVAPSSVVATRLGLLVWLGRDGFYGMGADGAVSPLSTDIDQTFRRLHAAALSRSTATWNPRTKEYLCAVPDAGAHGNNLLLTFDGEGWRRQRHGIRYASLCATRDWRGYVLGAGQGAQHNVFVLGHEVRSYTPPAKTSRFKSAWLKVDALGRTRFNVGHIYLGFVEASSGNLTVTWYGNGRRDTAVASGTVEGVAPDLAKTLDEIVLGTDGLRTPRMFWKRVDVRIRSVDSFAFDVECTEPTYMHLAAFAFDEVVTDTTGARMSRS